MQSLGKAGTDFPLPSPQPVHKRARAGTQTRELEPVTRTHVPPGVAAVSAELWGLWAAMGVEQGGTLVGRGKEAGTWGAAQR